MAIRRTCGILLGAMMLLAPASLASAQDLRPGAGPAWRVAPRDLVVFPQTPALAPVIAARLRHEGFLVLSIAPVSGMIVAATRVDGIEAACCAWIRTWPGVRAAERSLLGSSTAQPACPPGAPAANFPCTTAYPDPQRACPTLPNPYPHTPPNDPGFCFQWGLANVGQAIVDRSCALPGGQNPQCWEQTAIPGVDVRLLQAWQRTTGSPLVTVCIMDSGIEYCNPDFDPGRFFYPDINTSCVGNASSGYPCCPNDPCDFGPAADNEGHGTRVASILGARAGNALGIAGVDQQCGILSARVQAIGSDVLFARVIYALELIGSQEAFTSVRVINMSFALFCNLATPGEYQGQITALQDALELLKQQNRFCVSTSTNFGVGTIGSFCPNAFDSVITVGGIDSTGRRYANPCGFSSGTGLSIDFVGPGMADFALVCQSNPCPNPPCGYTTDRCSTVYDANFLSGSSFAAPVVSGAISLILAHAINLGIVNPVTWEGLSWDEVYELLRLGSRDRVSWENGHTGDPNDLTGWDTYYGWGLIDIDASLCWLEELYGSGCSN